MDIRLLALLFEPKWKRIFDRVHHYGLYTIIHR